jgi:myo-inositol-1(or 4)-monophosphatase
MTRTGAEAVPDDRLREIETTAVGLARLAGAEIINALGTILTIRYKGLTPQAETFQDPVSEVDHHVEGLIRARLAERFPDHEIIGEEINENPIGSSEFVWAIDPIDGTTNFINGFPLFAASIGVLHRGCPVAGALWCSTGHKLRPGVYHARIGGRLHFDEQPIEIKANPMVMRRLAGEPDSVSNPSFPWETRRTGSAAIECAFVAAGLLRVARFVGPYVWDVAGGLALVRAAGGEIRTRKGGDAWQNMVDFLPAGSGTSNDRQLRAWRQPLIVGERDAVEVVCRTLD